MGEAGHAMSVEAGGNFMAHVLVLGAGLGGTMLAYELREKLGKEHRISVVAKGSTFVFVPSNPWVAVGWRDRGAVEVDIAPTLRPARHRASSRRAPRGFILPNVGSS